MDGAGALGGAPEEHDSHRSRSRKTAVLKLDSRGTILEASRQAAVLLGRQVEELRGAPFGVILQTTNRIEIDVVVPRQGSRVVAARAVAVEGGSGATEVHLEEVDHRPTLAEAAHRAMAEVVRACREPGIRFTVEQTPGAAVIEEACEIIRRTLALLVEMAGVGRGVVSLRALPEEEGGMTTLVLRFAAEEESEARPGAAPHTTADPFPLISRVGGRVSWQFDEPVTTVVLELPKPGE